MVLLMVWNLSVLAAWFVGPFIVAGTLAWRVGWVYVMVLVVGLTAHRFYLTRRNPGLVRQRKRVGHGTKRWDLFWVALFWPLMVAVPAVAGLGVRHAWRTLPYFLWPVGLALFVAALVTSAWAMAVNPHFEGTVRIQTDRQHRVIDVGPYRWMRHPGYLGLSLWALGSPLLLLSLPAYVPAVLVVCWLILRTVAEDSTLRRELGGYREYCARTRYFWFPGVW